MDITKIKGMARRCYVVAFRKQLEYASLYMASPLPMGNPHKTWLAYMHHRYAAVRKRYARLLWGYDKGVNEETVYGDILN